jgi:hypothetical protein
MTAGFWLRGGGQSHPETDRHRAERYEEYPTGDDLGMHLIIYFLGRRRRK